MAENKFENTEIIDQKKDIVEQMQEIENEYLLVRKGISKVENVLKEGDEVIEEQQGFLRDVAERFEKSKILKATAFALMLMSEKPAFGNEIVIGHDWTSEESSYNKAENATEIKRQKIAEAIRQEVYEHIDSEAYLKKLSLEFDGNIEKAKEMQKERLELVKSVKIYSCVERGSNRERKITRDIFEKMNDEFSFDDEFLEQSIERDLKDSENVDAYQRGGNIVVFKDMTQTRFKQVMRHEILHASTDNSVHITPRAIEILGKSFNKEMLNDFKDLTRSAMLDKLSELEYLSNVSERLVRKQQLDKQLEDLGIKKYSEKFTKKHYEKMMEAYNNNELNQNSLEFIKITKPDFEIFKTIMDTMADTENLSDDDNQERVA